MSINRTAFYRCGDMQLGQNALGYAAIQNDLLVFEYLLEKGAVLPTAMLNNGGGGVFAALSEERRRWAVQLLALSQRWRLPLIAIREIHGFVIGFNWAGMLEAMSGI